MANVLNRGCVNKKCDMPSTTTRKRVLLVKFIADDRPTNFSYKETKPKQTTTY